MTKEVDRRIALAVQRVANAIEKESTLAGSVLHGARTRGDRGGGELAPRDYRDHEEHGGHLPARGPMRTKWKQVMGGDQWAALALERAFEDYPRLLERIAHALTVARRGHIASLADEHGAAFKDWKGPT